MDRFIPNRSFETKDQFFTDTSDLTDNLPYKNLLSEIILNDSSRKTPKNTRTFKPILNYQKNVKTPSTPLKNLEDIYENAKRFFPEKNKIKTNPLFSSPSGMLDDFYLNILDWSDHNNILSFAECRNIIFMSLCKKIKVSFYESIFENAHISSLKWIPFHDHLTVGYSNGIFQILDINKLQIFYQNTFQQKRIDTTCVHENGLISYAGLDKIICNMDRRSKSLVSSFLGHSKEICGLIPTPSSSLISGSNDNTIRIWDIRKGYRLSLLGHKAAIKALSLYPQSNRMLVSGGGCKDFTIKVWDIETGFLHNSFNTKNQVCGLKWTENGEKLISIHGYYKNNICFWKFPQMLITDELVGHVHRVLFSADNKNLGMLATAAPNDSLKIWSINEDNRSTLEEKDSILVLR